ncbi:MAG TPA: ATP-dependent zinc metalloprotease FtsH [Brevefilum fermentans]|uniref:ATP-dependent zinc metalloprotease FtsH n=1 Tax=Candidatus Brevifilum fermentans TaxID=1986204 RepID=A0A1Y6K3K6_9CHLR|nr:ATP-dependent zinc metalloprotease FtsH [Brevefilum fermentans]MDI9566756.1 ATP-dependent zinc metalloprotease FtsH [Chloroflexota bacterium]SMX54146.1 ATP-dependent zinc metalloprotease FtsH 1 [Brevefilum fermentans]HPX96148.1 ATP-dependent zinc metalloprotease FtsH [Brevefilum fermentans]HQA28190.1 ATP-dependent zinc metalloprotease FtsH [Brevefilum fermentans]
MKPRSQSFIIYVLLFTAIIAMVYFTVNQQNAKVVDIPINQLAADIREGKVKSITEDDSRLQITYKNNDQKSSTKDPNTPLITQLIDLGVTPDDLAVEDISVDIKLPGSFLGIISILSYILPFIILIALFWFIFRQAQGSNTAALSFGKSKARMFTGDHPTVTFEDVAGVEEAKEELQEIVEFLREPQKFIALGARIPKGVLLVGAPGTGKTLMAKAVSGEAGVPFFSISGSEFVEMFVGVGASRVRDLFEQAKRHSPSIVFVDEIDAVGRHRGAGLGGSHDEREQTLNQLLVEMDGFDTDTNVIIIAATNRPDILDPALLRPGRFDRRVTLDRPDIKGREEILEVHVKGKPIAPDVDLADIARSTPGFVGADLENLVNEAAILAARRNKRIIERPEFMESIERVIAGPERKSRLINPSEKRIIAYHEAGHAVVINALPEADNVQKVSIISRGEAGGYTIAFPEEDRMLKSRKQIMSDMITLLGGRAAEEIVFNDITSGASNDLERATKLARTMVMRLGMSDALGPMVYGKKEELVFLGREISEQRDYSEHIAEQIDTAIQELVQNAYQKAKDILNQYRTELDKVAEKLLEVESITAAQFFEIFPTPVEKTGGIPQIAV